MLRLLPSRIDWYYMLFPNVTARKAHMNNSPTDQQLLQILKAPAPTDIAGVVAMMQAVDNVLPSGDGLKCVGKKA